MNGEDAVCLGCGRPLPEPFLDLGKAPLANALVRPEHLHIPEARYPLAVAFCDTCSLVQLTHRIPPEQMFSEYFYVSSYSDTFLAHARDMAQSLIERFQLGPVSRVIEIASNDGYLLQYFQKHGIPVLGVEPAANIAVMATDRGVPTLNRFFGPEVVQDILEQFGQADLIIGNNVLAHVPAINDFLSAVKSCLKPSGAAVFEFPYLRDLLERTEFDTIYHEHVFYFSLVGVKKLGEQAGLDLFDAFRIPIHGGSLRVFLARQLTHSASPNVGAILAEEQAAGLAKPERYASFSQEVATLRRNLLDALYKLRVSGKRGAGYGAPAKGTTLLNYCGIGRDYLEFTVDRSPQKQGLYLPGTQLPIHPPERVRQLKPDYLLILPWNLRDEIMEQMAFIRDWGGQFVIPIPRVALMP
jgi:SAM-dependent methyltransferase